MYQTTYVHGLYKNNITKLVDLMAKCDNYCITRWGVFIKCTV